MAERCGNFQVMPDGKTVEQCDHAAMQDGRFCTCCELMAGQITVHEAVHNLSIPHLVVEGIDMESGETHSGLIIPRFRFDPRDN